MIELFSIGFVTTCLIGCATPGRVYDDRKVAMINKDTTEANLLEWFGYASSRTLEQDGGKVLKWKFTPRKVGSCASSGSLTVRLGTYGNVMTYAASGTTP